MTQSAKHGMLGVTAFCLAAALFAATPSRVSAHEPGCCEPPVCTYNPCIKYVQRGLKKVCCGCEAPQQIVMIVKDPAECGGTVDVPMCIPACCTDEPCVKSRCGLFGRRIVWYEWCCGFKARVTISECGDLTVTYFGR